MFEDSDIMFVTIDGKQTFQLDPVQAKCFTPGGDKMTCETLAGVGNVEKARVTVMGDLVQRIDVLALQQYMENP